MFAAFPRLALPDRYNLIVDPVRGVSGLDPGRFGEHLFAPPWLLYPMAGPVDLILAAR